MKLGDQTRRKKVALDKEETKILLNHVRENSPFWFNIVYTLLHTGLRRKELIDLEWTDIDFDAGLIRVRSKPDLIIDGDSVICKTSANVRSISMNVKLQKCLCEVNRDSSFVLSSSTGSHVWNNFN